MRIDYKDMQIELHDLRQGCLWVVFDQENEEAATGRAPDRRLALRRAKHAAWMHINPLAIWIRQLTALTLRQA